MKVKIAVKRWQIVGLEAVPGKTEVIEFNLGDDLLFQQEFVLDSHGGKKFLPWAQITVQEIIP